MVTFQVVWVMFLLFVVLVLLEEEVACVCFLIVLVNMKKLLQMMTFLHFVLTICPVVLVEILQLVVIDLF